MSCLWIQLVDVDTIALAHFMIVHFWDQRFALGQQAIQVRHCFSLLLLFFTAPPRFTYMHTALRVRRFHVVLCSPLFHTGSVHSSLPFSLSLSRSLSLYSEIKGTQDQDLSGSFSDSLSILTLLFHADSCSALFFLFARLYTVQNPGLCSFWYLICLW